MSPLSSPRALVRVVSIFAALAGPPPKLWPQPRCGWRLAFLLVLVMPFASDPVQAQVANTNASVTATGVLEVLIMEDFERPRSAMGYFLREHASGRLLELEFRGRVPEHLETGRRVTVRGQAKGRKLQVEELSLEGTSAPAQVDDQAMLLRESRGLVALMVDLQDAQASTRYTLEDVAGTLWLGSRSMSGLYKEASLGQLEFESDTDNNSAPDVFGPFAVSENSVGCNFQDWSAAAEQAAEASGIDLSLYQHRVFILPNWRDLPDCSWSGVANVGCSTYCRAWIAEAESPMVFAHELGHNLNLGHAATDPENDGEVNAAYGDYSDAMGLSRRSHTFNAAHIDQLNWYEPFPESVEGVSASGTYQVAPIGVHPDSTAMPHILKIEKADSNEYYYLSYRQPIGYDDGLTSTYTQGVNVHRYKGSGYGYTHFITSLNDFESFSDEANGITVTQLGHDTQYATVEVVFAGIGAGCVARAPVVTLSPTDQLVQPGEGGGYTVSVTNRDDSACAPTLFDLGYQGSAEALLSVDSMTLASGETASAELEVNTLTTSEGHHDLVVTAADRDGLAPEHADVGSGTASITVDGTPPSVPSDLRAAVDTSGAVRLTWMVASDSLSGVAEYLVHRDDIVVAITTVPGYTDLDVVDGARYRYAVTAIDAVGNASAPSASVSLSVDSGGDEGTTLHVADLDARAMSKRGRWTGEVTVMVRDALRRPVADASVVGRWSNGASGAGSCVTDATGTCVLSKAGIRKKVGSITFGVSRVNHATLNFDSGASTDPDGDSDGTSITVHKP